MENRKVKRRLGKAYEKMADGGEPEGFFDDPDAVAAAAGTASTIFDSLTPGDRFGVKSGGTSAISGGLKGAGTGAAIGSIIPGVGTAIGAGAGAIIGGIAGIFGNNKAKKAKKESIIRTQAGENAMRDAQYNRAVAADPSLKAGRLSATYFKYGGTMKGTLPATTPRLIIPNKPVMAKMDLLPNVAVTAGRQLSRMADGGKIVAKRESTRIPKPVDPKLPIRYDKNTQEYFDEIKKTKFTGVLGEAKRLRAENGYPEMRLFDPEDSSITDKVFKDRPHYNPFSNTVSVPHNKKDTNPFSSAAELYRGTLQEVAHAKQFNESFVGSAAKFLSNDVPDYIKGKNPYKDPNALEYDAHTKVQQKLVSYAKGGKIEPLSTEEVKMNGKTHAEGGIKLPHLGVEVEDGETINNGFVFSKKLGFADKAEKVAKQLGKVEDQPDTVITRNTANALKRKTSLLKIYQETAKQQAGIPNDLETMATGGPIKPRKRTTVDNGKITINGPTSWDGMAAPIQRLRKPTAEELQAKAEMDADRLRPRLPYKVTTPPTPSIRFADADKTRVAKGPFIQPKLAEGNTPPAPVMPAPVTPAPVPVTPVTTTRKPLPRPNSTGTTISPAKTNGPKFPLPSVTPEDIANVNIPEPVAASTVQTPAMPTAVAATTAATPSAKRGSKFLDGLKSAAPFLSNINNALTKLPLPPNPILEQEVTPATVNYDASRAETIRQTRGANKAAEANLNSGSAVAASRAANLTQQQRALGQVNEAEQNTNAQINNQASQVNAGVRARNNDRTNNYNNELVSRKLKSQQLRSENLANVEEKIQGMSRDKKLFDLEDQKVMLEALKDDTGAGFRGARSVFGKHLSPDSMAELDAHFGKLEAEQKEDRKTAAAAGRLQLAYLKKQAGVSDKNKSITSVLGKVSTVIPDKDDKSGNKRRK